MSKDRDNDWFKSAWAKGKEKDEQERPELATDKQLRGAEDKVVPLNPSMQRSEEGSAVFPANRVYEAFDTSDRAERLHIVRANDMARRPAYYQLSDMSEDVFQESCFTLFYPFLIVEVYGRHLGPVMHAIGLGKCHRIREYSPKLYDSPPRGAPLIESIVITDGSQSDARKRGNGDE